MHQQHQCTPLVRDEILCLTVATTPCALKPPSHPCAIRFPQSREVRFSSALKLRLSQASDTETPPGHDSQTLKCRKNRSQQNPNLQGGPVRTSVRNRTVVIGSRQWSANEKQATDDGPFFSSLVPPAPRCPQDLGLDSTRTPHWCTTLRKRRSRPLPKRGYRDPSPRNSSLAWRIVGKHLQFGPFGNCPPVHLWGRLCFRLSCLGARTRRKVTISRD